MKIISEFGIDPILLVAQIVNFLIIFIILKRFLYKPVLEMLKKREETIKDGLKKAEEAQILLEKTTEKEKGILKNAQEEAVKIIDDARGQSQELARQNEELIKKQSEAMIKETQLQIQQETKKVEQQLAARTSQLAVEFLQKILGSLFTKKHQEEILSKALKQFKESN